MEEDHTVSPQAESFSDGLNQLDGWEYHFAELLTGGEDISVRSELIKEAGVINAENLYFAKGRIIKDTGYKLFGAAVRGTPRIGYQFFKSDGSSELTLLTNTTFYRWVPAVSEWQYVSGGTATTLTADIGENLLTYSEQLDHADWVKTNCTVSADATLAPDGTTTADKVIPDNLATSSWLKETKTLELNTQYTLSVYGKSAELTSIRVNAYTTEIGDAFAVFDLSAGTVTTEFGIDSANITSAANGFYRCTIVFTVGATVASTQLQAARMASGTGDGASGFYAWGASLTKSSTVKDYFKTEATANDGLTLTVADITGFSDGDHIGVLLDDGTEHKTTINGAPSGSSIVMDDVIAGNAASGNAVVKPLLLSGDDAIPPSVATWAAKDRMYFTNGIDTPQYYDGTECQDIPSLPGSTFTCRLISIFNDYLQLLFTTEDGVAYPQRIRWANAGFDDQWNELVNFNDFYQSEDWITAVSVLGPYNIIYRERGIIRQAFLGETDKTWEFTPTIDGEGAVSADAVISLGNSHLVFGNSNIYEYFGEFDLTPIGDEIYDRVFGLDGDLNPSAIGTVFSIYLEELDEVWMFYPQNADEAPKTALRYKIATKAWSHRTWPVGVIGYGFYQSAAGLTWENAQGTWAAQTSIWVTKIFLSSSPTTLLCDADNVQVYEYDYVQTQDNGTDISYVLETKDYYHPIQDLRFDRFDFMMLGSSITIEYSTDKGVTWTALGIKSPGSTHARVSMWKQFVAPRIRFRLSGTSTFGLEWLGFRFKLESARL